MSRHPEGRAYMSIPKDDNDQNDELEEEDELEEQEKYLNNTVFQDLMLALYEVRYSAPFVVLLGVFLAYHLTIAPYQSHVIDGKPPLDMDLSRIRPILSQSEQLEIHRITMEAETKFIKPGSNGESVGVRWFQAVGQEGNHNPPDFFYEGVLFGVSQSNAHELDFTRALGEESPGGDLYKELSDMFPKPTLILERQAFHNKTDWKDEGYAAYFSYSDLAAQGKLSSDKKKPWKFVSEDVMKVARMFRQVYITVWYANDFGGEGDALTSIIPGTSKLGPGQTKLIQDYTSTKTGYGSSSSKRDVLHGRIRKSADNPYLFKNVIQQVLPTRTGLNAIPSTVVVWLSSYNSEEPVRRFGPLIPMDYDPHAEEEAMRRFEADDEADKALSLAGRGGGDSRLSATASSLSVSEGEL